MKPVAPVSAMRGLLAESSSVAPSSQIPALQPGLPSRTGASLGRIFEREPQDLPVGLVGQGIDRAIRSLGHVADAHSHGNSLLGRDPLPIEGQANDRLRGKSREQEIALPARNGPASIESYARGRDDRRPLINRVGKVGPSPGVWNGTAVIMFAPAYERPAIVAAGCRKIELVSAQGSKFAHPKLSGLRMDSGALHVAVTIGPDLGLG